MTFEIVLAIICYALYGGFIFGTLGAWILHKKQLKKAEAVVKQKKRQKIEVTKKEEEAVWKTRNKVYGSRRYFFLSLGVTVLVGLLILHAQNRITNDFPTQTYPVVWVGSQEQPAEPFVSIEYRNDRYRGVLHKDGEERSISMFVERVTEGESRVVFESSESYNHAGEKRFFYETDSRYTFYFNYVEGLGSN